MALGGASTHLAILTLSRLRGRPMLGRLTRIYSVTAAALLLATVTLGLVIYPAYKVHVVAPYFWDHAKWAAALFDVKEALGLFALPLGLGLFVMGRRMDPDKPAHLVFAVCAFGLFLITAFCIVAGLVIVAEKGV
ncbi:MAG: hypothetical protein ACJ790_16770 [Myxococcaceae bacterium]